MSYEYGPKGYPQKLREVARVCRQGGTKTSPTSYAHAPQVAKSVPQQEILAHPKTRLFITHGSINAAMESIFHRVPMVTIPIFTDQGWQNSTWHVLT